MPKLILTLLLFLAAFCVNAQTKDSTYKTTHDSLQAVIIKDTVYNWYDSTYKTISRDSSYNDTTWTYCKVRQRSLLSFYWLFGGSPKYRYCDTIKKPRREYNDSSFSVTTIYTTTQPKDTTSSFCCHIKVDSSIVLQWKPVTHDTTVKVIIPTVTVKWGLKIQNDKFTNQLTVAKALGITAIRPNSIGVKDFNGDLGNVISWKQNGFITVMNVNWIDNPNLKPYDFVSGADTVIFKTNFEKICQLAVGIVDLIVLENEPTNLGYYNWKSNTDASDYIHELKMAITIAHKYGLKISDGCVHLELVEMVRKGTWQTDDKAIRAKTLMDAYKTLNLDYVDFHTSYDINRKTGAYPVLDLPTTINYLKTYVGHIVYTNEYSITGGNSTVINWFVNGYKAANIPYSLAWSGDGTKSDAYNIGITLTDIGKYYRDDIR